MLARVSRYQIDPDRCDDAVRAFEDAGQELAALIGLSKGWILIDTETGETLTVTLWTSQQALDTSSVRAAGLRQKAVREVEGEVQSVQSFDVVREFGG